MAGKPRADIAVIGGSGLYEMEGLTHVREVRKITPFGKPSDAIVVGTVSYTHLRAHETLRYLV